MTAACDQTAITGLWFEQQKYYGSTLGQGKPETVTDIGTIELFRELQTWLTDYFAGKNPPVTISLHPQGSEFQQRVWKLLSAIPYGQTTTYGALAGMLEQQTGRRASAQAVGQAVGHNPIGILIPCHRVIGSDGSLTGYAGGLDKKQKLLKLEQCYPTLRKNG